MTARLSDEAPHYPHDPGTPDAEVAAMRLRGRRAARRRNQADEPPIGCSGRVEWWLGWLDVRLERFYVTDTEAKG